MMIFLFPAFTKNIVVAIFYFSRYCTKHLGQSPSACRQSLQPK